MLYEVITPQIDALVFLDLSSILFHPGDAAVSVMVGTALDTPDGAVDVEDGTSALPLQSRRRRLQELDVVPPVAGFSP